MLTRRQALVSTAALPFAAAIPAHAAAPMLGASSPQVRRVVMGEMEITTFRVAQFQRPNPHEWFGTNVSADEVADANRAAFLDPATVTLPFTPTIVNTGGELILFDTGLDTAGTTEALAAGGYTPGQVDKVVLSHLHGDHIGGLLTDGAPTFANAQHMTAGAEFDFWAGAENDGFEGNVRPIAERIDFIGDGADIGSGVTGIMAAGHTPGHMVYRLESGGQNLILFADLANHPVLSLANPDWHFGFDGDPDAAVESRRRVLTMIAEERIPAIGYHMPFPSMGYVDTRGEGFHWVPESGQLG